MKSRWLAWIVNRFFPPKKDEPAAKKATDPYRPPPPAKEEHPIDCMGCKWLDDYGRWQPPEVVLGAGVPFSCLTVKWGNLYAELIEMAGGYGLVVRGGAS